jgi:hypothetical protein
MRNFFGGRKKRVAWVLLQVLIFVTFFLSAFNNLDPDFGWHLRLGEIILRYGIPKTDPFSFTMASFPAVDSEWLTNVFINISYPMVGKLGLAVLFAFLPFFALALSGWARFISSLRIKAALLLLTSSVLLPYIGVRPQILTWVFLALIIRLLTGETEWRRWRLFVPAVFMLWANTHGGFFAGLVTFGAFFTVRLLRSRKFDFYDAAVLVFSILATFVNPYGWRLWSEVLSQITDTSIHWTIQEWWPSLFSFNFALIFLIALSAALIRRFRKSLPIEYLVVYLGFLYEALTALRHVPLWLIFTLPIIGQCLYWFYQRVSVNKQANHRFNKVSGGFLLLALGIVLFQLFSSTFSSYPLAENTYYPKEAVMYLRGNPPGGNLFSLYSWGGYLDWKLPEKKVFIDGRMATWRSALPAKGESGYIFGEYSNVVSGKLDAEKVLTDYQVDTVLWPTPGEVKRTIREGLLGRWFKRLFPKIYNSSAPKELGEVLLHSGWYKVYQDKVAVVYRREINESN